MSARANPLAGINEEVDEEAPQLEAEELVVLKPKVSVRLEPRLYYGLVDFCAVAAKARGKRVTHVEVYRALTAELLANEELRKRVINKLRGGKAND